MRARNLLEEQQNIRENPAKRLANLELALRDLLEITRLRLVSVRQCQVQGQGYDLISELKNIKKRLLEIQELAAQAALKLASPELEEEATVTIKEAEEKLAKARNTLDTNLIIFKATQQILKRTDSNRSSPTLFSPPPKPRSFILNKDSFKNNLHSTLKLLAHAASFIIGMIATVCSAEYDKNSHHHRRHTR